MEDHNDRRLFRFWKNERSEVMYAHGGLIPENVRLTWLGPRELLVEYIGDPNIRWQHDSWHGVMIIYQHREKFGTFPYDHPSYMVSVSSGDDQQHAAADDDRRQGELESRQHYFASTGVPDWSEWIKPLSRFCTTYPLVNIRESSKCK